MRRSHWEHSLRPASFTASSLMGLKPSQPPPPLSRTLLMAVNDITNPYHSLTHTLSNKSFGDDFCRHTHTGYAGSPHTYTYIREICTASYNFTLLLTSLDLYHSLYALFLCSVISTAAVGCY